MSEMIQMGPNMFMSEEWAKREEAEKRQRLRDEFAMAALQGLYANGNISADFEEMALVAFKQADAMLAQREKAHD